ncbi:hypothetical protein [Nocardia brasiliensis]|uniref:hypothetical protein n=1 Tax=Nocardia brasiliensis TaxID=37326 RepID=UPI003D8D5B47
MPLVPGNDVLRDLLAPGGGLSIGFDGPVPFALAALRFLPDLSALFSGRFDTTWLRDRLAMRFPR